jgi:hypothetical protein
MKVHTSQEPALAHFARIAHAMVPLAMGGNLQTI